MLNRIIWQAATPHTIGVMDGDVLRDIEVTPIIAIRGKKITVGLSHQTETTIGLWLSSGHCDFMQAWRTAQLLGELRTLRDFPLGVTSVDKLLQAVKGSRGASLLRCCAHDLGLSPDATARRLSDIQSVTVTDQAVAGVLENLPEEEREICTSGHGSDRQDSLNVPALIELVNSLGPAGAKIAADPELSSAVMNQRPATLRDICGPEAEAVAAMKEERELRAAAVRHRARRARRDRRRFQRL